MDIGVISYNMSVFSAMGYYGTNVKIIPGETTPQDVNDARKGFWPSEARFLRRAPAPGAFFRRAVVHLHKIASERNAKVIGIQEFHPPTLGEIKSGLSKNFIHYEFAPKIQNDAKVVTLWDKTIFGDIAKVYDADLGLTPGVPELKGNDTGRPISIIVTTSGTIFINFHGINRPKFNPDGSPTGEDAGPILKKLLQIHAEKAGILSLDLTKLIIMCDSNDREHSINANAPLILNGIPFSDGRAAADKGAISCCYNCDSCGIPFPAGVPSTLGAAGAETKYIYTGDYVMVPEGRGTPVEAISSAPHLDADGASMASDHKLVVRMVTRPAGTSVGSRRRRSTRKRASRRRHNRKL
jgi:hypothetical protein